MLQFAGGKTSRNRKPTVFVLILTVVTTMPGAMIVVMAAMSLVVGSLRRADFMGYDDCRITELRSRVTF